MTGSAGPGQPAIVTPDAVGLDVDVATVGSRGVAYLIDLVAFLIVLFALTIAQSVLGGAGFVPGWLAIALLLLLAFAWQFGYPIGFETLWRGRTPGKAALGLRVVTTEGAPIGVRHASVRAIIGILELLGTFGAVAIISSLISSRSQRLGDLAAGTMVVRERRASASPTAEVFSAPAGFDDYVRRLDVTALGPQDYATVRETLRRQRELPATVAHQVTTDLADRIVGRVTPVPPPGCDPGTFLRCVAAAIQDRRSSHAGTGTPAGASRSAPGGPDRPVGRPQPPAHGPGPDGPAGADHRGFHPPS